MTWVKRTPDTPEHTCAPPMRQVTYGLPAYKIPSDPRAPLETVTSSRTEINGQFGDLWRCDQCGKLWWVGDACDACDWNGNDRPHRGMCTLGLTWRPATLWQRLRHRRRR